MFNPFVRKLELLGPLPQEARRTLEGRPFDARQVGLDQDLVRAGERPSGCKLVVSGFARRYKLVDDDRGQITSSHTLGNIVDLTGLLLGWVDRGICTVTRAGIVLVPHAAPLGWAGRQ